MDQGRTSAACRRARVRRRSRPADGSPPSGKSSATTRSGSC